MARANPLKLNNLQLKTLVLTQILARSQPDEAWNKDGTITILRLPHAHGDHLHVGEYVVSSADATGFNNRGVWGCACAQGTGCGQECSSDCADA